MNASKTASKTAPKLPPKLTASKIAVPATPPVAPAASASSPAAPASASAQVTSSTDLNKAAELTSLASYHHVIAAGGSAEQNNTKDSVVLRIVDKTTPVFLSYQNAFTTRVLQLRRALEARSIPCWMATEDLVGNVQDAIGEALMAAPAIIICYSHSYRESMYASNVI